jgi:hypothetical protein
MPVLVFNLFNTNGTHILKGKIIPVHMTIAYLGSWGRAPLIFNPGTWCMLAVNIFAQPFNPWTNPGAHWTGDWVGSQIQTVCYREEKISCPCQGSNLTVHPLSLSNIWTTPLWFPIFWVIIYTMRFVYMSYYFQLSAVHLIHPVFWDLAVLIFRLWAVIPRIF